MLALALTTLVVVLAVAVSVDARRWLYWRRERARVRRMARVRRHQLRVLDGGKR